jgi:hypothetical protein
MIGHIVFDNLSKQFALVVAITDDGYVIEFFNNVQAVRNPEMLDLHPVHFAIIEG